MAMTQETNENKALRLLKAYNKSIDNKDMLSMRIIYTQVRNLGFDFTKGEKYVPLQRTRIQKQGRLSQTPL